MKRICFLVFSLCMLQSLTAQSQTREELEKQRQQLKKEIDEAQKLLSSNKAQTKKGLSDYFAAEKKVALQTRVLNNIDKDIHMLDDNIYIIQKDVNRYNRLLDTLKQEYAKSMVYAYKNRGSYEFLNFIFSASNFNDAVKRAAYLKSYRSYRELQGQNILRTQELRRQKLADLGLSKQKKSVVLTEQTKEVKVLEEQKNERNKIVLELKKEGKDINARLAAKQKQMAKVNGAIKSAIAKAIAEEKKRIADLAAAEKVKKAADAKNATASTTSTTVKPKNTGTVKAPTKKEQPTSEDLNRENLALSNDFEQNRGKLPWPVDNGSVLQHFGPFRTETGSTINNNAVSVASPVGASVKAVFDGTVILVTEIEEGKYTVTVRHGNYFTSYVNMSSVPVKTGQDVKTGTVLGKVAQNIDGIGAIDMYLAKGNSDIDPEKWLRRR